MDDAPDSDLRLGQLAVRMGLITAQDLPELLREARSGHTEESAGRAQSLGQLLIRKRLVSVSDYLFISRQARKEQVREDAQPQIPGPTLDQLETALGRFESGELDGDSLEALFVSSEEPLVRPQETRARFGEYELLGEIGRGGMGIVYKARKGDGPVVALKVMIEADDDEVRLQRFEREAELAAAMDHPGIVRVYDAGRVDGIPYFTMDLVEGDSLDDLLDGPGLERDLALRVLAQAAQAVDHAHERGIIHRDLKPGNIMIEKTARHAKITDFGLARDLARVTRLTQVGQAVGTPYYMAPEQVRGERDVDGRCDIYAIGVILYEVLTGDVPFDANSPLSLFKKIDTEPVVLEVDEEAGIDARIHAICTRALAKDREERYPRGRYLAEDLERYLRGQAPKARTSRFWTELPNQLATRRLPVLALVLGVLALVVTGTAGVLTWRAYRTRQALAEAEGAMLEGLEATQALCDAASVALALDPEEAERQARAGLERWAGAEASAGYPEVAERFAREGGAELKAELLVVLARSLLVRAGDDPAVLDEALEAVDDALESDPGRVGLRLEAAQTLAGHGALELATQVLDRALDRDPEHVEALVLRGRLLAQLGRPLMASRDLSEALWKDPEHLEGRLAISEVYLTLGELELARDDAEQAAQLAPLDPRPLLALGQVHRARGALEDAREAFGRAARLASQDPEPHLRLGELALGSGSSEQALQSFGRAAERGAHAEAALGRARAALWELRFDDASEALDAAVARLPELEASERDGVRARVALWRGRLELARGRAEKAREVFLEAAEAAPRALEPRLWVARIDLEGRGPTEARRALEGLPEAARDDPGVLTLRSQLALSQGHPEDAAELAREALAAAGSRYAPRALHALAHARLALHDALAARDACKSAWVGAPRGDDLASVYLARGLEEVGLLRAYPGLRVADSARRWLEASVALDPRRVRSWATLGTLERLAGNMDPAWSALTRAAANDPSQPELAEELVRVALEARHPHWLRHSLSAMDRVLERSETVERLSLQARARARLNLWEEVLESLDRLEALRPTEEGARLRAQALRYLEREAEAELADAQAVELSAGATARLDASLEEIPVAELEQAQAAFERCRALRTLDDPRVQRAALLFAARLPRVEERLRVLSELALLPGAEIPAAIDGVLAPGWSAPLAKEARQQLMRRMRQGGSAEVLAFAMAVSYDAEHERLLPEEVRSGLEAAEAVCREAPASLLAQGVRARLRALAGDAQRASRELGMARLAAPESAWLNWVESRVRQALGDPAGRDAAWERARDQGLAEASRRRP